MFSFLSWQNESGDAKRVLPAYLQHQTQAVESPTLARGRKVNALKDKHDNVLDMSIGKPNLKQASSIRNATGAAEKRGHPV